jgi:hypothetical protein
MYLQVREQRLVRGKAESKGDDVTTQSRCQGLHALLTHKTSAMQSYRNLGDKPPRPEGYICIRNSVQSDHEIVRDVLVSIRQFSTPSATAPDFA